MHKYINTMMFMNKYDKYNFSTKRTTKKYFTSDDVMELGEANNTNYNNVLKVKNLSIKLWSTLDDIEKILYKENLSVINECKPVFDQQKLILIKLDAQIENIYQYGLMSSIKKHDDKIKLDNIVFKTETMFSEWNKLAIIINAEINILKNITAKEKTIVEVIKTIKSFDQINNKKHVILHNKSKYMLFLALLLVVLFVYIIYFNLVYYKYL